MNGHVQLDRTAFSASNAMEGKIVQELVRHDAAHDPSRDLLDPRGHRDVEPVQGGPSGRRSLDRDVPRDPAHLGRKEIQDLAGQGSVSSPCLHDPEGVRLAQQGPELLDLPGEKHPERRRHVRAGHEMAGLAHRGSRVETLLRVVERELHELGEGHQAPGADRIANALRQVRSRSTRRVVIHRTAVNHGTGGTPPRLEVAQPLALG